MSRNLADAETMPPQKGSTRCCHGRPMVAVDKPMSCRAKETGLVSVAECLWFEAEAAPMERHNVQKHVLGLHDKAVDGH